MGLKKLEQKINSGYIVTKTEDNSICFGNSFKTSVIKITNKYELVPKTKNDLLATSAIELHDRLSKLIEENKLKEILEEKDEYKKIIDVYTFKDGKIIKEQCEEFGYPNVTIQGSLMYENTHYLLRSEAVVENRKECLSYLKSSFRSTLENIRRVFKSLKYLVKHVFKVFKSWI